MVLIERPERDIFIERGNLSDNRKIFGEYLQKGGNSLPVKDRMEVTLQLAFCDALTGHLTQAAENISTCRDYMVAHGRAVDKACLYHVESRILFNDSKYEEALTQAVKSLHIFSQLPHLYFIRNTATACGVLCSKLNLFAEAMDYMGKAHSTALQMGDHRGALDCLANLNDIRLSALSVDECIQHNTDLLKQIEEVCGTERHIAQPGTYMQLAYLYLKKEKVDEAADYTLLAQEELKKFTSLPPHYFLFTNLHVLLAEIAGKKGNEKELLKQTERCIELARMANKAIPEADAYLLRFTYYADKKNIKKAGKFLTLAEQTLPETDRSNFYMKLLEYKARYYSLTGNTGAELAQFKLMYDYKNRTQQEAVNHRNKYIALVHELEVKRNEVAAQQNELNLKTQELNLASYYLEQRNQLLTTLKESVTELQQRPHKPAEIYKTITQTIDRAFVKEENEKQRFRDKFDETHRGFIAKLHQLHPQLSPTECRVAALLRAGFNTKEIANLLSTQPRNIENHRLSIRKKMELKREDNLNLILAAVE